MSTSHLLDRRLETNRPRALRFIPIDRLCENSFGALRPSSGRTVKYVMFLTSPPVRAEATRSIDGIFTQSVEAAAARVRRSISGKSHFL